MTYDPFRSPAPWRHQFDNARDPYTARNALQAVGMDGNGDVSISGDLTLSGDINLSSAAYSTWTPVLTFATPGDLSITYAVQLGVIVRLSRLVLVNFNIVSSAFTHTTASGNLLLTGLPVGSANVTNQHFYGTTAWRGITKATYTDVVPRILPNTSQIEFHASGSGAVNAAVVATDTPTGGTVVLRGQIIYLTA